MIHPSYVEMIDRINDEQKNDREEAPLVNSRYSIVLATARRARQLIAGAEPLVPDRDRYDRERKSLSIAVDELYEGKVHILRKEASEESEEAEETESLAAEDAAEGTETAEDAVPEDGADA